MENFANELILEASTNTHTIKSNNIESVDFGNGILKIKTNGNGIVTHGEHGTIRTESEHIVKYVQQEYNPVTRLMQAAFD